MLDEKEIQRRMQLIEELVRKVEASADPGLRATARELLQLLMDIHGAGVERILEIAAQAGDPGREIIERFGQDPLVRSLLLLYGLHPVDLESRVLQALEKVRPRLEPHGGAVTLLGIDDGVVRLRLEGSGQGCGSSAQGLRSALEEALYEAAPDAAALIVEGIVEEHAAFVPLAKLQGRDGAARPVGAGQP